MRSEADARARAKRLFETGRFAGVDAYKVTGDPKLGEYDEPVFLVRAIPCRRASAQVIRPLPLSS